METIKKIWKLKQRPHTGAVFLIFQFRLGRSRVIQVFKRGASDENSSWPELPILPIPSLAWIFLISQTSGKKSAPCPSANKTWELASLSLFSSFNLQRISGAIFA